MSAYPPPPPPPPGPQSPGSFERRIEEAIELIEMELRHAIAYVNDAVVPQVRRESISAMRAVADTLRNLADRMDRNSGADAGSGPANPGFDSRSNPSPNPGPNPGRGPRA